MFINKIPAIIVFLGLSLLSSLTTLAQESEFVPTITQDQANYLTPENTLASVKSGLKAGNLSWADEGLTQGSLKQSIETFASGGIDRNILITMEQRVEATFIVEKTTYKNASLLIIEDHVIDSGVKRYPVPMIQENGLWKITNEFSGDEELSEQATYIPPPEEPTVLYPGSRQRPKGTNKFLQYAQPTKVITRLEPGASEQQLHIFYGDTIKPKSFRARLNGKNIKKLFSPARSANETITIPLQPGRNVLKLSVVGTTELDSTQNGKKKGRLKNSTDTDRFAFIVKRERKHHESRKSKHTGSNREHNHGRK